MINRHSLCRFQGGGRGNEGGIKAAARELNINREDARRAVRVASLSEEAKDVAVEVGLDNNRTALLEAAEVPQEGQADYLRGRRKKKDAQRSSSESERARLLALWIVEKIDKQTDVDQLKDIIKDLDASAFDKEFNRLLRGRFKGQMNLSNVVFINEAAMSLRHNEPSQ